MWLRARGARIAPFIIITIAQGVTKRCRLSLLTNSTLVYESQCRGIQGGCGVSASEYSCAHHVTWSPNKLLRSTSIFNLCFCSSKWLEPDIYLTAGRRANTTGMHADFPKLVITYQPHINKHLGIMLYEAHAFLLSSLLAPTPSYNSWYVQLSTFLTSILVFHLYMQHILPEIPVYILPKKR